MKCRYKQKLEEMRQEENNQKLVEVYGDLTDQFLAFLDYTKGEAMHVLFGHGKGRLDKLYEEHLLLMATMLGMYEKDDMDPNYSQNTKELYDRLLKNVGVDIEALKKEHTMVDRYKEPALEKQKEYWNPIHDGRVVFVREFDRYATTSVAGALSYVNGTYGYGKIRLERLFHWVWSRYVTFCEQYLLSNTEGNKAMIDMVESSRKHLAGLNLKIFSENTEEIKNDQT